MDDTGQPEPGLAASVRRLTTTVVHALTNRFDLFALELREERDALLSILLCAVAMLVFGLLAAVAITATVVILSPPRARPYELIGFSLLYLALTLVAGFKVRRQVRHGPPPFAESIAELRRDISALKSRD